MFIHAEPAALKARTGDATHLAPRADSADSTVTARSGSAPGSTALALVRAYAPSLGPREGAVARIILERPDEIQFWSTQELAAEAGTSAATVIRACKRLGFRGYQHLRLELAREETADATDRGDSVTRTFESAREALALGAAAIEREALIAAASAIFAAQRVMFTANGFSAPPLQDAAMRFATVGRAVEAPLDILAQQFVAHTLGPRDVCLALSHSGANAHTLAAVRAAKHAGATIIAVCSYSRAPIPELADVVVSTGAVGTQHTVDPFYARINHSVALQALLDAFTAYTGPGDTLGMREVVADALADGG